MGFNQRTPNPVDPAVDPLLPQADSSQPHDIPTGVSPTTAKLQDWIAWISENGVFFSGGTTINSDITINGDLSVILTFGAAGAASFGSNVAVGGHLSIGGGIRFDRVAHGTLASNTSITDADYLHEFTDASASVDVALGFDVTSPRTIHCYCTSSSLANDIEFRYSGILIATWPASTKRPFVTFVMGALLPEPIAYGGGTTLP